MKCIMHGIYIQKSNVVLHWRSKEKHKFEQANCSVMIAQKINYQNSLIFHEMFTCIFSCLRIPLEKPHLDVIILKISQGYRKKRKKYVKSSCYWFTFLLLIFQNNCSLIGSVPKDSSNQHETAGPQDAVVPLELVAQLRA